MSQPVEEELDPAAKRSPLKVGMGPKGRMGRRGTMLRGPTAHNERRRQTVCGMSHGFEAANLELGDNYDEAVRGATTIQATSRRFLVRLRAAQDPVAAELIQRQRERYARLSDTDFSMTGSDMLRDMDGHTDEALNQAVSNVATVKRNMVMRYMACSCVRLLQALSEVRRLSAARTEGRVCAEASVLLADLLDGPHVSVYPVDGHDGDEYVRVHRKARPDRNGRVARANASDHSPCIAGVCQPAPDGAALARARGWEGGGVQQSSDARL